MKYLEKNLTYKDKKKNVGARVSEVVLSALNNAEKDSNDLGYTFSITRIIDQALQDTLVELFEETGMDYLVLEQFKFEMNEQQEIRNIKSDDYNFIDFESKANEIKLRALNDSSIDMELLLKEEKEQTRDHWNGYVANRKWEETWVALEWEENQRDEFTKMKMEIIFYMNEINCLLPKEENFYEPQPVFADIFVKNIYLINIRVAKYIARILSYDPAAMDTIKRTPEKIKATCLAVSRDFLTGSFVKRMALQEDPPLIKIYADGEYVNGNTDAIKINIKNNNLLLSVMNLSSYAALKNAINTLDLGQLNYIMDQVYTELDIDVICDREVEKMIKDAECSMFEDELNEILNEELIDI